MASLVQVAVHPSQFPEALQADLVESLRARKVNHKFHYDSAKQTQKWLALHQAYSPARTDPECAATYDRAFRECLSRVPPGNVELIGLGCGGGHKDATLLKLLRRSGRAIRYWPCDVSLAMVLVARQTVLQTAGTVVCYPVICDLATADDLSEIWPESRAPRKDPASTTRLCTFFGMLPNFEPELILPRLSNLLSEGELLLLSANLAPGTEYTRGVERALPLYDNSLTRDWLLTFLLDLGFEAGDGDLRFSIEDRPGPVPLKRISAEFHFVRDRTIQLDCLQFQFRPGESMRLFFSYRHTPELVRTLLAQYALQVLEEWITPSAEEGVFLATKIPGSRAG